MEFSSRHERELAEIKALTNELDQRVQEGLGELERIRESQDKAMGRAGDPRRGRHRSGTQNARRPSSAADRDGSEPLLAFVHIPKTAGGSVMSMFTAAYSKKGVKKTGNYVSNPEKTQRKISKALRVEGRVSFGHTPYGALRHKLPPDTRYVTFLREPVDRVLSHYYRHIELKHPKQVRTERPTTGWNAKANSIEEALVEMHLPQMSNLATRFLVSDPSPPMATDLPAGALEDAKASLRAFAFVGIQERFEESLVLLQRDLGLGQIPYRNRHVSSGDARPTVDEIPDEQRALIEEYNALDAELYRFGVELFEEAVAAADESFAADVEALRAGSATDREEEWRQARGADG
jgi:hypothetical protein